MLFRMRRVLSAEQRSKLVEIQKAQERERRGGRGPERGTGESRRRTRRPHVNAEGGRQIREEVVQSDPSRVCDRGGCRAGGRGHGPGPAGRRRPRSSTCWRRPRRRSPAPTPPQAGQQAAHWRPRHRLIDLTHGRGRGEGAEAEHRPERRAPEPAVAGPRAEGGVRRLRPDRRRHVRPEQRHDAARATRSAAARSSTTRRSPTTSAATPGAPMDGRHATLNWTNSRPGAPTNNLTTRSTRSTTRR